MRAAKRISNPGCYATSSQLLLAPLVDHIAPGALPTIFGMSGYSGAGTVMEKDATTGKLISLYVLGDEFTGTSIDSVVRTVDLINREDRTGERRVRIHALGFPVRPDAPQFTSVRFSALMRVLCARNGGTFVGLNEPSSYAR